MIERTQENIMQKWPKGWSNPAVSIICLTYNHKAYISQALDGFLMQNTDFPFEVVVHDDASNDGTTDIIRMYEKKYPMIIKPIYEQENQYSKKDGAIDRIVGKSCNGKYIAFCEGDDYWINPYKLEKQYNVMESDSNISICGGGFVSHASNVDHDYTMYFEKPTFFSWEAWHSTKWFMKTLTVMYRREVYEEFMKKNYKRPKDTTVQYHALKMGKGVYIPEKMGVYNKHDGGVWSASTMLARTQWEIDSAKEIYEKNNLDPKAAAICCSGLCRMIKYTKSLKSKLSYLREGLGIHSYFSCKIKLILYFFAFLL